jgi:uncharacterized protein
VFDLRSVTIGAGEQHREALPVAIAPFTIGLEPYVADPSDVVADFAVTRMRNGWVFDAAFAAEIHGSCHRCLGPAVTALEIDTSEFHAFRPDAGAEAEMTCEFLHDEELDTDALASAAVVLAMPVRVLCRDDCAGLCAGCGADLNAGPCTCAPEAPDARWAKLRELQE